MSRSDTSDVRKLVTKSAIRRVPIDALGVDASYQREVKPGHKKIMADYNEQAFGVPLIGEREDCTLWIVDGYQRITAVKKLGHIVVRVEVFASKGPEHEAAVFKLVNLDRTRLRPLEEFKALLTSHDPVAWEIKEVAEACGYVIGGANRVAGANHLTCVNTLFYLRKWYGVEALEFVLTLLKEVWPEDRLICDSNVIHGFSMFYHQSGGVVDREKLTYKLQTTNLVKIIQAAKARSITDRLPGDICEIVKLTLNKRVKKVR